MIITFNLFPVVFGIPIPRAPPACQVSWNVEVSAGSSLGLGHRTQGCSPLLRHSLSLLSLCGIEIGFMLSLSFCPISNNASLLFWSFGLSLFSLSLIAGTNMCSFHPCVPLRRPCPCPLVNLRPPMNRLALQSMHQLLHHGPRRCLETLEHNFLDLFLRPLPSNRCCPEPEMSSTDSKDEKKGCPMKISGQSSRHAVLMRSNV